MMIMEIFFIVDKIEKMEDFIISNIFRDFKDDLTWKKFTYLEKTTGKWIQYGLRYPEESGVFVIFCFYIWILLFCRQCLVGVFIIGIDVDVTERTVGDPFQNCSSLNLQMRGLPMRWNQVSWKHRPQIRKAMAKEAIF